MPMIPATETYLGRSNEIFVNCYVNATNDQVRLFTSCEKSSTLMNPINKISQAVSSFFKKTYFLKRSEILIPIEVTISQI